MSMFGGRPAWTIDTGQLRVTVLACGGHVAEIVLKHAGAVNPLWIQGRPTIDSDQFDPVVHGAIYGTDSEARLISGLAGHSLCFPFWGAPSASEHEAGMTFHGETNIVRWEKLSSAPASLTIAANLPNSSIRFERTLRCDGPTVYFDEAAENLSAWDRPVAWCEHVTLGPPFLDPGITQFQAPLTRGFRTGNPDGESFAWPEGRGEIACDLTTFSARPHADLVNSFLVDPSHELAYFAAWHPGHRLLFGYAFRQQDFPWLNIWENNDARRQTRGMEFSATPVEGTMRALIETPEIRGIPTFEWLPARGKIHKRFAAFSAHIPADFSGIDLDIQENELRLPPHGAKDPLVRISILGA